jgi:hypothetical protein
MHAYTHACTHTRAHAEKLAHAEKRALARAEGQPLGLAHSGRGSCGERLCTGPRRSAQEGSGGAVYMSGGTVTFTGGSSITGTCVGGSITSTHAVRFARTHARACVHALTGMRKYTNTHKHAHAPTSTHPGAHTRA